MSRLTRAVRRYRQKAFGSPAAPSIPPEESVATAGSALDNVRPPAEEVVIDDLAKAFVPQNLLIEMTSKCNLRCLYCQKSDDNWNSRPGRDDDMSPEVEHLMFSGLSSYPFRTVQLSGIGEFTMRKNWVATINKFTNKGIKVALISNFAKPFDETELNALLKLHLIMVSVDSTDPAILRSVRKSVSFSTIAANLLKLRILARRTGVPLPFIKINAVLYVENLGGIEDLAYFAIENRVSEMQYERMFDTYQRSPPTDLMKTSPESAKSALGQIATARRVLEENNILCSLHGDMVQLLEGRANV